jgi:hypothetical protein
LFYYGTIEQCAWDALRQVFDLHMRNNIQVWLDKVFQTSFFECFVRCRPCNSELSSAVNLMPFHHPAKEC